MGKGTILENLGEGQYVIVEDVDFSNVQARLVSLLSKETELQSARADAIVELNQQEAIKDAFQIAIDAYVLANPNTIDENLRGLIKAQQGAAFNEGSARINLSRIDADIFAAERDIKILDDALEPFDLGAAGIPKPFKREKTAWCADYTTDLTGEVGTIDINRQVRSSTTIIQPGESPRTAAYDVARDGQIQPALAASPYGTYWNAAQLPGAGVWRARHAVGTLTDVNKTNDTATVAMDVREYRFLTVSIGGLFPNKESTLSNIPIDYSTCNSEVFDAGDRVVVEFDDEGQDPTVIGFEANPVLCTGGLDYTSLLTRFVSGPKEASGYEIVIQKSDVPSGGVLPHSVILKSTITNVEFDFTNIPIGFVGSKNFFTQGADDLLYLVVDDGFDYKYTVRSNIEGTVNLTQTAINVPRTTDIGVKNLDLYGFGGLFPDVDEDNFKVIVADDNALASPVVIDTLNLPDAPSLTIHYSTPQNGTGSFARVAVNTVALALVELAYENGVATLPFVSLNQVMTTPKDQFGTLPVLDVSDKFNIIG